MRELAARSQLDTVTAADLPPGSQNISREGWSVDPDGAWLLRALRGPGAPRRSDHMDIIGWEAYANGRDVYDLDLDHPAASDDRAVALLRRGFALVTEVLKADRPAAKATRITGAVSIALSDTSGPTWVAGYWFWAEHGGERPYFEVDEAGDSYLMTITR